MQQKGAVRENVLSGEAVIMMLSVVFFSLLLSVIYIDSGLFVSYMYVRSTFFCILPISISITVRVLSSPIISHAGGVAMLVGRSVHHFGPL